MRFLDPHLGAPPKEFDIHADWQKNDANQDMEEEKKESVGFFSVNSSFFSRPQKKVTTTIIFHFIDKSGSSRDHGLPRNKKSDLVTGAISCNVYIYLITRELTKSTWVSLKKNQNRD